MTSTGKMKIHFGTANDSAEDYYYIQIGTSTASALGVGNQATASSATADARTVSTQEQAQKALLGLTNAVVSKDKIRAHLAPCRTVWKTPFPTLPLSPKTCRRLNRAFPTWTWPRK
mgnify:CR=1 FL=1